jgi:hypothetical protein
MSVTALVQLLLRCRGTRVLHRLGWLTAFTVLSNLLALGALLPRATGPGNFGTYGLALAAPNIVVAPIAAGPGAMLVPAHRAPSEERA